MPTPASPTVARALVVLPGKSVVMNTPSILVRAVIHVAGTATAVIRS